VKNVIFIFLVSVAGLYASIDEALQAYKQGRYEKALYLYEKEAKKGDTTAMNALSYLYHEGIGTKKDRNKSLEYLQKAADKEDARACLDLGLVYLAGKELKQDYKLAAKYLECAAKKNETEALYNLALMYYNGDGVRQDAKKAAALLERAAKLGHQRAKANVGRIYMQALNFSKAKEWLRENVKDGDKEAALLLEKIEALP
jgi:TPR repeat protein